MAKVQKADRGLGARLDEFEKRLFLLKIQYDKYFSGLEPIEPVRERDELRRIMRDLLQVPINNSRQRFVLQNLRARFSGMELYWVRNLAMMERGTHPKQRYKADQRERQRLEAEEARARAAMAAGPPPEDGEGEEPTGAHRPVAERAVARPAQPSRQEREDAGYKAVFDKYLEARASCGQSTNLEFAAVREALKKQVDALRAQQSASTVRFRVVVEEGKARIKAVPVK